MALQYYSKADGRAIFYIAIILVPIIAACLWFGIRYNDLQVNERLAAGGVTVYTRVSNIYKEDNPRGGPIYYAVLDYIYKGNHLNQTFKIDRGYCHIGDTIIIRRLVDNNSPSYMKIIGARSNGADLFKKY